MLDVLRRKKNSPIIAVLLGAIIIVFIAFFGNSWSSCAGGGLYAARVNGVTITDQEYAGTYSREYQSRQGQDGKYDREKAKRDNLRESVLNRMMTTVILAQDAEKRGLAVDKEALREAIVTNPNFQTDGRFDRKLYERYLNYQQTTDYRFEQQMKQELLAMKVASVVQNSVGISEAEAKESYMQDKRRINVEFVAVKKQPYEAQVGTVSPADAEAWLKKEGSEEEVKKFYTKNLRTRYNVPKQVCAAHILVRVEKGAPPDINKAAHDKIAQAAKAVKDGMDFAEAARKFSDDSTKDKGGDLGCFGTGQMVQQFEEAAFGLKAGEVSNLVETPFGLHIIKVREIKDPVERKLEDVKSEIALEIMKSVKAGELAKKRAEEILAKAKSAPSLQAALAEAAGADPLPLKVEETGPFPKRDFIPRIGLAKDVSAGAWKLTTEKPVPDQVYENDSAAYVLRLKERVEPTDAEFEKDKKMLVLSGSFQKRNAVVKAWTDRLRKTAKVEIHPLALSYDEDARQSARSAQQRNQ